MRTLRWVGWLAAGLVLVGSNIALATDVFNLGGVRDPVTGTWTGTASLEMVPVGNPGNAADTRPMNDGTSGYGSVAYSYNIGKYEVTAGQYTAFLNAVAKTDTYALYSTSMWSTTGGCKIQQSGSSGNYTYSVASDWANRPVNYVSYGDTLRFANWLHNGQPTGGQGLSTTEDGAYYVSGATTDAQLLAVTRKTGWQWAVTSENEWYKAAHYDPNKAGGAGYRLFPTGMDSVPSNVLSSSGSNNANFYTSTYTIGSPYWRTEVGAFASSDSPYGTFDQGGNVWEWDEAIIVGMFRSIRGGAFSLNVNLLQASNRNNAGYPSTEGYNLGFRVSETPEPATLSLLAVGGAVLLRRRRAAMAGKRF